MMTDDFESRLSRLARELPYPPTPQFRSDGFQKPARSAASWRVAGAIALLLVALLAVPQVRAGLLEFIQLGAVRVNLIPPTATAAATPLASLLDLAGETTLAAAQRQVNFTIVVPADFGEPAHVFVQDLGAPAVVLVWLNAEGAPRLSLHEIGPGSWAVPPLGKAFDKAALSKFGYELIEFTEVNGNAALWVEGERVLIARDGAAQSVRLVDSPALIWETFGVTYRLEGDFTLEEMKAMAESLR